MASGLPIDIGLKPPTLADLRTCFMGEFSVILATTGILVGIELLEQLADVAIGDVRCRLDAGLLNKQDVSPQSGKNLRRRAS